MSFNDEEIGCLRSQRLARIATVAPDGQPDVVPVGYEFDGTHLGPAPYMRITPTISWSWNLKGRPSAHDHEVVVRRTTHRTPNPSSAPGAREDQQ